MQKTLVLVLAFSSACASARAVEQTTLPDVHVTGKYQTVHGGYLISSDFDVDSHMSAVVYPAEPFEKGDVVAVQTMQMQRDEYLVLQECISLDCTKGHILRVWKAPGAIGVTAHSLQRVSIPHEGKFFFWMQRFPIKGYGADPFSGFEAYSPPLVLNPIGSPDQFQAVDVEKDQEAGPVKVVSSDHEGASFVIRFEGGSSVLLQRMHALR